MKTIAILFALLLAVASTFASLDLPDGYWVAKAEPVPEEHLNKKAKGNPYQPLVNASIMCSKRSHAFWKTVNIWGFQWPGLTEKMARGIVEGSVTQWHYTSWEKQKCFPSELGQWCSPEGPGFKLRVSLLCAVCAGLAKWTFMDLPLTLTDLQFNLPYGGSEDFVGKFGWLTGIYGTDGSEARFLITDGNDTRWTTRSELYEAEHGKLKSLFGFECPYE